MAIVEMKLWLLAALVAVALLQVSAPVDAAQVTLGASKDNTLYQDFAGELSNGAGEYLFAGNTKRVGFRRGLLAFDIAGNIAVGSTIDSVELRLTLSLKPTDVGATTQSLHRVLADWGEGTSDAGTPGGLGVLATPGDATWFHTFSDGAGGGSLWTTPGGDSAAAASASQSVDDVGSYTWSSTLDLVADVQAWLDSPSGNFGWAVIGDEATTHNARRYGSRENSVAANRPQLVINYTETVPEPQTLYLLLFGSALAVAVRQQQMNPRHPTWPTEPSSSVTCCR